MKGLRIFFVIGRILLKSGPLERGSTVINYIPVGTIMRFFCQSTVWIILIFSLVIKRITSHQGKFILWVIKERKRESKSKSESAREQESKRPGEKNFVPSSLFVRCAVVATGLESARQVVMQHRIMVNIS